MRPRLVEISAFHAIIDASAQSNVAVFFHSSEDVLLFGSEQALDRAVDEMIFALGYVPRNIIKEIVLDVDIQAAKLEMATSLTNKETLLD